jgi:hypothetical protein
MRTIEHYVLINGKVICEMVSKDEMNAPRASVGTESMNGGASSVELPRRTRPKVSTAPEASDER